MSRAKIKVNGVDGSDTDLPINTLVQLSNDDDGDESTYLWSVEDQPSGTADNLSATSLENPTITPKKEGPYRVQLITDEGLATEQVDSVILGVRYLKSQLLPPAVNEETERGARGWADPPGMDSYVGLLERLNADPAIFVAQNDQGGALDQGDVVYVSGVATLKVGLPGEEKIPKLKKALATSATTVAYSLAIIEGGVDGTTGTTNGELARVRMFGFINKQFAGSPTVGDLVYVSDTGAVALAAGSNSRKIGHVIESSGGLYRIWFDGAAPRS